MARRDIVVLGASAGGVDVLVNVLGDAASADATFVVVVHMAANARTALPEMIHRHTGLEAKLAADGDALKPGRVLIAPPNLHTLVRRGHVSVVHAPRENRARPAIDPLFRTAASSYGPRVIAVGLSGVLDDGTAGAGAVRAAGGILIAQDPDDALFGDMPQSMIDHVGADFVLPSAGIGGQIALLTCEGVEDGMDDDLVKEPALAGQHELLERAESGVITAFTCPECSGTLWEVDEHGVLRYRCRVGHVYSPDALRVAQSEGVETALWVAMRALEEQSGLMRRTADRARTNGSLEVATRVDDRAKDVDRQAQTIRELLNELTAIRERTESGVS